MTSILSASHFHNEDAAFAFVEAHLWPNRPRLPALRRYGGRDRAA